MKLVLRLTFLFFTFASQLNAQNILANQKDEQRPAQVSKTKFGAKIGLNASNTDFNRGYPTPLVPVVTTWQPGIAIGFFLQVPVNSVFSLQQEYIFSQMNGKIKNSGTEYKLSYLSLPLVLKLNFLPRFALLAGPQFDLLIHAQQLVNGNSLNITHDTEERSIGATAGLEYYVLKNISLTARYVHGLNNIGIGQRSATTEFKYESVQITTEIKF